MIAFLLAILLAGSLTMVVFRRMRASSAAQSKLIQLVAADRDLASGNTLTAKDLRMIDWPADVDLPGSFRKPEDIIGRPLVNSIGAKQPVLERSLGALGSGLGLSGKIPKGMRATAVRSNEIVGVAGFLYPGSHVDVLVTYTPLNSAAGPVTQTVLQNVEVLTAGSTIEPDPQGKPQTVNVVTLLVTPEDSQKLLLSSAQGTIQFVLRSGVDAEKMPIQATRINDLEHLSSSVASAQAQPAEPPPVPKNRPAASKPAAAPPPAEPPKPVEPPKPPEPYALEVIQGTQRTIQKFDTQKSETSNKP